MAQPPATNAKPPQAGPDSFQFWDDDGSMTVELEPETNSKATDPREAIGRTLELLGQSRPDPDSWTAVDYVRQERDR